MKENNAVRIAKAIVIRTGVTPHPDRNLLPAKIQAATDQTKTCRTITVEGQEGLGLKAAVRTADAEVTVN